MIQFQRLSSSRTYNLFISRDSTVRDALPLIAENLGEDKSNVDIISNGTVVEPERSLAELDNTLSVVVHPRTRPALDWCKTNKPDMINDWDDDDRVLMSCGHAINPDTLYSCCWSQLTSMAQTFRCPGMDETQQCDFEWEFIEVVTKARLSDDEQILFETRINSNWNNKSLGVRECPFCQNVCERQDPRNPGVRCLYCKNAGKEQFEFCWFCLLPWNGNHSCSKDAARMLLKSCKRKEIIGLNGCPSVRACPKCQVLIEHTEACKQMECKMCQAKFCFICLRLAVGNAYQCGSYDNKCEIAPIQDV